jgi:hypothetical protein
MTQTDNESTTKAIEEAVARRNGTAPKSPTTIWYWVREWSESTEFPEVTCSRPRPRPGAP